MLRIFRYCSFLLLCFLITGSQAAAIGDHDSLRESPEAPEGYEAQQDKKEENVTTFDIVLRFVIYTVDPIGGGNLVRAAQELTSSEEARDAGKIINRIIMMVGDFEERFPSIADKIRTALDQLFIYGPVGLATTEAAAEAREEATTLPTYNNIFPLEAMIDSIMEEFQNVGGLLGIGEFLVNFLDNGANSPLKTQVHDFYTYVIELFSA